MKGQWTYPSTVAFFIIEKQDVFEKYNLCFEKELAIC